MALVRLFSVALLIAGAVSLGAVLNILPHAATRRLIGASRTRLCQIACALLRIDVAHEGPLPGGNPTLLVANHVSWTDVLAFGSLAPINFLARHDLAHWPALGPLARVYGTLFVERGRLRQIPGVNNEMAARMAAGEVVTLFPEATTSDGTRLRKFHTAHFAAARSLLQIRPDLSSVAIAPAAIAYTRRRGLPLGRAGRADIAWYGDTEFAPHLLDLARGGRVSCRISFLEPIAYERSSDRKSVARCAGAAIRAEMARLISTAPGESAEPYVHSDPQRV